MKISVCLASYNGDKYIVDQLNSILPQLSEDDELIVADDASTDQTVNRVLEIDDNRIKLLRFNTNVKHVKNFERAIEHASGDIIFLSDQDDIWESNKIQDVMNVFKNNPDVIMVQHSLSLIDSIGQLKSSSWYTVTEGKVNRIPLIARQLIRGQVFGCASAFRRSLLNDFIPFPRYVYAHDHWLTVVSAMHGEVFFLNKPLVRYRQHSNNVSPAKGLNLIGKIRVRCALFKLILIALIKKMNRR